MVAFHFKYIMKEIIFTQFKICPLTMISNGGKIKWGNYFPVNSIWILLDLNDKNTEMFVGFVIWL